MHELYGQLSDLLSHGLNHHFRTKQEFSLSPSLLNPLLLVLPVLVVREMTVDEGFISKWEFFQEACFDFTNSEHFNFLHSLITTEVLYLRVLHNVLLFVLLCYIKQLFDNLLISLGS